jgi:hypothetical protein
MPSADARPVRWYLMFRAVVCLAAALALPLILFEREGDTFRTVLVLAASGVLAIIGALYVWRWRQSAPAADAEPAASAARAPEPAQVERLRRVLWITPFIFAALTAIIVSDLCNLESGEVNSVRLWAPVAMIYDHLGFWPAVLIVPVGGIVLIGAGLRKLRKMRTQSSSGRYP